MALPGVESSLGIAPPAFVRKLTRKSHWGIASDDLEQRLNDAVEKIFPEQSGVFSVFQVDSDVDLRRIALAFNANRSSYTERLDLVAFAPEELQRCQIAAESVPESGTRCNHANRRHCHITASTEQLRQLCELAMTAGRAAASLTTSTMRDVVKAAEQDRCRIVTTDSTIECDCERD